MKKEYSSGKIMMFILAWFVFMFGGLYTYDWINKLLILIGSGFLAREMINWCWRKPKK